MYKDKIRLLENQISTNDNTIFAWEKAGKNIADKEYVALKNMQSQFKDELRRLNRLQWEHDHERVHFDDDR